MYQKKKKRKKKRGEEIGMCLNFRIDQYHDGVRCRNLVPQVCLFLFYCQQRYKIETRRVGPEEGLASD